MNAYRAFGLTLRSGIPLPVLPAAKAVSGPVVEIELADPPAIEQAWSGGSSESEAVARVHGGLFHLWRGWAGDQRMRYGQRALFHVSADGRRILCAPADPEDAWWKRELLDTVLWLTALGHGYEGLHASAVEGVHGVVAIVAATGGGKSSLAAELVRAGARLFCDDVLTLEGGGGRVRAHPGPPLMTLPLRGPAAEVDSLGESIARLEDEVWVHIGRASIAALPVAAVCLLERGCAGPVSVATVRATPFDIRPYLFVHPFLPARERERFLIGSDLVAGTPVVRLRAPAATPPAALADSLTAALPGIVQPPISRVA